MEIEGHKDCFLKEKKVDQVVVDDHKGKYFEVKRKRLGKCEFERERERERERMILRSPLKVPLEISFFDSSHQTARFQSILEKSNFGKEKSSEVSVLFWGVIFDYHLMRH